MTDIINGTQGDGEIETTIHLNHPDLSPHIWAMWEADEGRHLPSEYLNEPASLFDDVMKLHNKLESMREESDDDGN